VACDQSPAPSLRFVNKISQKENFIPEGKSNLSAKLPAITSKEVTKNRMDRQGHRRNRGTGMRARVAEGTRRYALVHHGREQNKIGRFAQPRQRFAASAAINAASCP
jgi:hypothetical protein